MLLAPNALGRRRLRQFVSSRVEALDLHDLDEYLALLGKRESNDEFSRLVAILSNPQTYFFRDERQFRAIGTVLETLASSHRRPLQIWSAGCATGEEPFSLAMLCDRIGIRAHVLGTDLNHDALEIARQGTYFDWSLRQLPDEYRGYFSRVNGKQLLMPAVRKRVELRYHNLVEDQPPRPTSDASSHWDLVLCRNVFIYFERKAMQQALRAIASTLGPDGWLFLSSAESLHSLEVPLKIERIAGSYGYRPIQVAADAAQRRDGVALVGPGGSSSFVAAEAVDDPAAARPRRRTLLRSTEEVLRDPTWSFEHATQLMDDGDFARARRILGRLVVAFPSNLVPRLTLGNLLLRSHAFDEALESYEIAHDINPLQPEVHYFQGLVFRKVGDLERAINAFRRALFLEPQFWCASFLLAGSYGRLGRGEPCRQNLSHTLIYVDKVSLSELFVSHTRHMPDANMNGRVVAELCRRELQLRNKS
jgi:chemotaxis protein methyltransferase CheR